MKKDRNCGAAPAPYPTPTPYPAMGYPMPGMPNMPAPMPMPGVGMYQMPMPGAGMNAMPMPGAGMPTNVTSNDSISTNQAITAVEQLQAQINNLDRRVSRIESMMQDTKTSNYSNNKYTDSNYHMM